MTVFFRVLRTALRERASVRPISESYHRRLESRNVSGSARYRKGEDMIRNLFALVAVGAMPSVLAAQAPAVQVGAMYQCPAAQSFQVLSCAGSKEQDACEVQTYNNGQALSRGKAPYGQVAAMARLCRIGPGAAAAGPARSSAAPSVDANGFKVGDTVQALTGLGWTEARILAIDGNNYRVHTALGADATKTYPAEIRRTGASTAADRAHGIYQLHDKVQVNFEGRWIESEVVTTLGMEYQVKIPGNRVMWTTAQNLRPSTAAAAAPAQSKAGQPPKPGLASCAGKIEGRYSSLGGFGGATVVFRSGKATLAEDDEYECWTGAGKIYLHKAGPSAIPDLVFEINNDGTLDSPLGEFRKKGN
jgi:hypothetical protein